MKDLIKEVVQQEQEAEEIIREARNEARSLLERTDKEIAAEVEVCRRSLQDETARLIREAQGEAARRLAEEPSAESRLGAPGGRTPEWVEGLAGQVADRILRTIFDRPGK